MSSLHKKRIIITRSPDDISATAEAIERRGGIAIACPTIRIEPPRDFSLLDKTIFGLARYDWLFFTSVHSVQFFFQRMETLDQKPVSFPPCAAIGPATQAALEKWGIHPDFIAQKFTGELFFLEFQQRHVVEGKRFLLPVSEIARDTLATLLRDHGGDVTIVTAYRNVPVKEISPEVLSILYEGGADWILFFSSSAVTNFFTLWRRNAGTLAPIRIASIGPSTSRTLREWGIEPDVEAESHTLEGMLRAIELG